MTRSSVRAALVFAFAFALTASPRLGAQTTSSDPARLNGQAQEVPGGAKVGTLASQVAHAFADEGRDRQAAAKIEKLWPNIAERYSFLGAGRGLVVAVPVYALKVAAPTLPRNKTVDDIWIVGARATPAEAYATADEHLRGAPSSDYVLLPDDSWFLWISPGSYGWPDKIPSYEDAARRGLTTRKESWSATIANGVALQTRFQAQAALEESVRYDAWSGP